MRRLAVSSTEFLSLALRLTEPQNRHTELSQIKNTTSCTSEVCSLRVRHLQLVQGTSPHGALVQAFLQGFGVEPMMPDGSRVSTLQADNRRERATVCAAYARQR